jgi:hypothetical protein
LSMAARRILMCMALNLPRTASYCHAEVLRSI